MSVQIIKLVLAVIINTKIKALFFIVIFFLQITSAQAKDIFVEGIVTHLNNQFSRHAQLSQNKLGKIIQHVNTQFIKTNLSHNNELVFILAGQSNMSGYGRTSKLPVAYRRTPANVTFYVNGYSTKMSRFAQFGPEVGFAHAISRRFPHKKIKLIKFSAGGTSLFAWDPDWRLSKARITRNASAGPLFEKLIKTIKRHTNIKGVRFAGILWMQGEADARYPSSARSYSRNLAQFITALRKELHTPSLAFFVAQVNPPAIKAFPYRNMVRQAQKRSTAGIRNSRLISTEGLEKQSDNLHYNTAGQLALGQRFAKAFIQTTKYHR